jgi:putative transposase
MFAADADYPFFRDALVEASKKHGLTVHADVWMTSHIHLLATPESENSISKVFQSVGRHHLPCFDYTYRRSRTLSEGRYRATVVDRERYLLTLMRYSELNFVRAGMVAHPRDYPGSSYRFNADGIGGPNSHWRVPHPQYRLLGRNQDERRSAYRQLFRAAISTRDLKEIRECTHKGWAWGGERFRAEVEALSGRRTASKGVGRPRKPEQTFLTPFCPPFCPPPRGPGRWPLASMSPSSRR